ncbi:hypothetical protein Hamer_G000486 [Homarus americanus]|uniref:Uncharacterized protein n=1 Tax=Homarus americanus TaxID=6706 RepID=A0A8J5NC07_HOMAM|nr:hypothetical protein Hamer_G000486 [Homarus americanus]
MNTENPGTFETEMNKMLKRNNLPTMSFPDNPASESVLQVTRLTNPVTPQETDKAEEKGAAKQTPAATEHKINEADKAKPQMIKTGPSKYHPKRNRCCKEKRHNSNHGYPGRGNASDIRICRRL